MTNNKTKLRKLKILNGYYYLKSLKIFFLVLQAMKNNTIIVK